MYGKEWVSLEAPLHVFDEWQDSWYKLIDTYPGNNLKLSFWYHTMGEGLKLLLSKSLEALEQGAFQEFCLSFLPLYDKKYKGLERHGATAGGKTRKGTPDLLKIGERGKQIAVQCSTEEDYWIPPSAYENWKPIKDIMKCIEALKSVEEIVLCSNREISPSRPNTKSEIVTWAKPLTGARITLLSISSFEEEILQNSIRYSAVVERLPARI